MITHGGDNINNLFVGAAKPKVEFFVFLKLFNMNNCVCVEHNNRR